MNRMLARVALFIFVAGMSIAALAGNKAKTETITLFQDAQLNGTKIPAGEYTVKYTTNGTTAQVSLLKGNKELTTATGQVKELTIKPGSDQVVLQNDGAVATISEIDFGGKMTAITFNSSMAEAGK